MIELLVVLVAAVACIILLLTLMLRAGPPVRWLPPAPSYTLVALFGAAYNAVIVRSLWATALCLGLAAVFRIGRWLEGKHMPREVLVAGGGIALLVANGVWYAVGYPGLR